MRPSSQLSPPSAFPGSSATGAPGAGGGAELFGGYPTLRAHRLVRYYERLPAVLRDRVVSPLVERLPVSMANISLDFKVKSLVDGAGYPIGERHVRWLGSFFSPAA